MNSDFSLMDSSSSAAVVSSSSAPPPWSAPKSYDVFISFRGQDTRNNFTSHLHAALCRKNITTFVDYKLKKGDPISTLFPIIENSRFAVIVFSEDYASSTWCLDEVVKILECKETHQQAVIPVFYNVEPSHVSDQTGSYAKSFAKHAREQIPKTTMQKWRNALTNASLLSGWDSAVTRPDSALIEKIVKDVRKRLKRMYPSDDSSLLGINPKVKEIESLLCMGVTYARFVGIWGIGGIGKTTLARATFDKIFGEFEGAYFIRDIGREAKRDPGLLGLRRELFGAILKDENDETGIYSIGLPHIEARFYAKKLLIVFDNVTDSLQIEKLIGPLYKWFNTGSRFIATTRDKQQLQFGCGLEGNIYKLNELLGDEALQLFSQHAFRQEVPMVEYIELSINIVKYAKGVPLALKVLGACLSGKKMKVWESAIAKLERIPNKEIHDVLKISYDGLDEDQKNIFLDIACFSSLIEIDWRMYFDSCGFNATVDLDILVDKCLLDDFMNMHDLLERMGREIVRRESTDDLGKRSRLWHHEDIYQVLRHNKGTEAIKGIILDMSMIDEINLKNDAFRKMKNLRILHFFGGVNKVHTPDGVDFVLNELRSFRWEHCPLKSLQPHFNPKNLIDIDITFSDIERLWEDDQPLSKLRTIKLLNCNKLTSISSLSMANCLDTLKIRRCSSLRSLSPPAHLRTLNIFGCTNLEVIPELPSTVDYLNLEETAVEELFCILHLSRLKQLHIGHCSKLKCLLDDIHELKSLVNLDIENCENFYKLPNDLGDLDALEALYIHGTALEELPSSIGCLFGLAELCLVNAKLKCLPSSICQLKSLKQLDLSGNKELQRLPHDLGSLDGLEKLDASDTALEELPSSIGCLSGVAMLCLANAKLKCLPSSICKLKSLKRLDLSGNKELQKLPHDMGGLEGLEELDASDISSTAIEELPSSIGCLSRLNSLWLANTKLKCLPSIICKQKSLKRLDLSGNKELQRLPHDLGGLEGLQELDASDTAIEELPLSISCLSRLTSLCLAYTKLKCLPSGICKLKSLKRLNLSGNKELQRLPHDLGSLENLAELNVSGTSMEELPFSVGYLSELVDFDLSDCSKLKYMPSSMAQYLSHDRSCWIRTLSLIGCYNLDWQLPKEIMEVMEEALLKEISISSQLNCLPNHVRLFEELHLQPKTVIIYPGHEIPKWFSSQNVGYSVTLTLPKELSNSKTVCFALSAVVDLPYVDIAFCCKLQYKDGHAQDRTISMLGTLFPVVGRLMPYSILGNITPLKGIRTRTSAVDKIRMGMPRSEGSHVVFGDLCVDCVIPISELQSAILTCEFSVYKKNESGELMTCYTVEACGIHYVSQNQN